MITCLDTGRTFGETAAEEATIVYGSTGAAAKEILSRDAGFEWVPSLTFLHERRVRAVSRPNRCRDGSRTTTSEVKYGKSVIDRVARRPCPKQSRVEG